MNLITTVVRLQIVGQSCWQGDLSTLSSIVELTEFTEVLIVELIQVPNDGASDHKNSDRDDGIPGWKDEYLRISARTAGECL